MSEVGSGKESTDELKEETSAKRRCGSPVVILTQHDETLMKVFSGGGVIQL